MDGPQGCHGHVHRSRSHEVLHCAQKAERWVQGSCNLPSSFSGLQPVYGRCGPGRPAAWLLPHEDEVPQVLPVHCQVYAGCGNHQCLHSIPVQPSRNQSGDPEVQGGVGEADNRRLLHQAQSWTNHQPHQATSSSTPPPESQKPKQRVEAGEMCALHGETQKTGHTLVLLRVWGVAVPLRTS